MYNKKASLQRDRSGCNIGMYAADSYLEKATLKALDNEEASFQRDKQGMNIGLHAASVGLEKVVLKLLDDKEESLKQDKSGKNIGMFAAINGLEEATLKALDNEEASVQQDTKGMNIGMYAAINGLEKATLKALDNEEASHQVSGIYFKHKDESSEYEERIHDYENYQKLNIGMFAALKGLKKATQKAWNDPIARKQKGEYCNNRGSAPIETCTIETLAAGKGILYKIEDDDSDLTR